jgi:hypothetical protein
MPTPLAGCGWPPEKVEALIKDDPKVLALWREATTAAKHRHDDTDNVRIKPKHGNQRAYTLVRLKRERPDIAARLAAGGHDMIPAMMDVAEARAFLTEQRARIAELRRRSAGEFETTRPTPNQDECDRAAVGEIVMIKEWDLSPIDPQSFDPFEPPGRPIDTPPPVNTTRPTVTPISGLTVGQMAAVSGGTWTGSPSLARQWRRAARRTSPARTRPPIPSPPATLG